MSNLDPDLPHLPDFDLPASTGENVAFRDFRGRTPLVVLVSHDVRSALPVFRPFDDHLQDFADARAGVIGVVGEPLAVVVDFAARHELNLPLLADPEGRIAADLNLDALCRPVVLVTDLKGGVREALVFPDVHVEGVLDMVRRVRAA